MKIKKGISFYIYLIASLLGVLAVVLDNEILMILTKPTIIPAIVFYYFSKNKKPVSLYLLTILLIYFVSDAITLLEFNNSMLYIIILDFIPYLLLLKFVVEDSVEVRITKMGYLMGNISFLILMICMYVLVISLTVANNDFVIPIIAYGIILAIYVAFGVCNYFSTFQKDALSILLAALLGLFSDVIYVVISMINSNLALNYIEFAFQIASYYFIVSYFINRGLKEQEIVNSQIQFIDES